MVGRARVLAVATALSWAAQACADSHTDTGDSAAASTRATDGDSAAASTMQAADGAGSAGGSADVARDCLPFERAFAPGSRAVTADGSLAATIIDVQPNPPQRYENSWTVQFTSADGYAAMNARLREVRPFKSIPGSHRDYRKIPVITPTEDPATYRADAINLWLPGAWQVTFTVDLDGESKDCVFSVCVP